MLITIIKIGALIIAVILGILLATVITSLLEHLPRVAFIADFGITS